MLKIKFLNFKILLILCLTISVSAHDYWFKPENFFLRKNEKTKLHLLVGSFLKVEEEREYQTKKTVGFNMFSKSSTIDLMPQIKDGASPVYEFSAAKPGDYLLAMERNYSYITLEADKFEEYLREEGLEDIIAERKKLGEDKDFGSERYSRFIKSLIQVGGKNDDTYKKRAGAKLEIVPLENPYKKKTGDELKLQVFFDGKPLAAHAAFGYNETGGAVSKQKVMTDENGVFSLKLDKNGFWLARLVVMRRCEKCDKADWESFWAAFSFGIK